jgi:predicted AAA+ superfamily ATPase
MNNSKRTYFKRKIYQKMLDWKRDKDGSTALLIKGARRVGKSTVAEEFAKNEYDSYVVINFDNARQEVWDAVKNIADIDDFFIRIQNVHGRYRSFCYACFS